MPLHSVSCIRHGSIFYVSSSVLYFDLVERKQNPNSLNFSLLLECSSGIFPTREDCVQTADSTGWCSSDQGFDSGLVHRKLPWNRKLGRTKTYLLNLSHIAPPRNISTLTVLLFQNMSHICFVLSQPLQIHRRIPTTITQIRLVREWLYLMGWFDIDNFKSF
jgi:hypothetical protein